VQHAHALPVDDLAIQLDGRLLASILLTTVAATLTVLPMCTGLVNCSAWSR